ncbi:hypothetical protein [uncultured Duncaniella sp.]|nr:hypothetical protein [uncultured Duncaniella sp.]
MASQKTNAITNPPERHLQTPRMASPNAPYCIDETIRMASAKPPKAVM